MNFKNLSKSESLLIVLAIYVVAIGAGVGFYILTNLLFNVERIWLQLLLANVFTTVIVYLCSVVTNNSSVYDPYWSVLPPFLVLAVILLRNSALNLVDYLMLFAVFVWAVRLTLNWARGWKGFKQQDWRYKRYKKRFPKQWQLINFFGIQLMPTLIVFLALTPLYFTLNQPTNYYAEIFAFIGMGICLLATLLEFVADEQMRKFKQDQANKGKCIQSGLWKYSRHPNYFGEILFWTGIFVSSCYGFKQYELFGQDYFFFAIPGFILMMLMFIFISIPLMEKHLIKKRPSYKLYKKQVSPLIPWLPLKTVSAPTAELNQCETQASEQAQETASDDETD